MKKILLSAVIGLFALAASAQMKNPVKWAFEAKKKTADTYEVTITATVDKPWHIYSQNTGGAVPTKFVFKANPLLSMVGKTQEKGKMEKVFDKNFNANVIYYSNSVVFTQTVKIKNGVKTTVSGTVDYMVCDDGQCLPPTKKSFDIKLP